MTSEFEVRRLSLVCSCGETLDATVTVETGTTTTVEAIQDAWYEEHPDGDYVHSRFHNDMNPAQKSAGRESAE